MSLSRLVLPAPAKLNLFLHITGQRDDGFHNLQTIFQLLDHGDSLQFEKKANGGLQFTCSDSSLKNDQNLIVKAVRLLEQVCNRQLNVHIHLTKVLPMGGGIGGGSSDCATALLGLNALFDLKLTRDSLTDMSAQLGADVPVFVHGKTAWAEGIGDNLTPIKIPEHHYIVIHPNVHVSTPELFKHPELTRNTPSLALAPQLARTGKNDFEPLVRQLYPEINQAFSACAQFGRPKLTGTGACLYIAFPDEKQAIRALDSILTQNSDLSGFVAKGVDQSATIEALEAAKPT